MYITLKRNTVPAVTTLFTDTNKCSSTPSIDPTPPFMWYRCIWTSQPVCVLLCNTDSHQDPPSCLCTLNHLCSRWRRVLRISSGSVFHLIGSRACWRTARRWRPHRPCGRRLDSLADRAVRCKRGGGDTLDMCPSVYCSLGKKPVHRHMNTSEVKQTQCVCVCLFFVPKNELFPSISHLPGWVLWACFGWTSPLQSAGWWSGRWGCCSGRGPVLLNGACGGWPGAEWSRWCPGLRVANTAWSATDCDCHSLEQRGL